MNEWQPIETAPKLPDGVSEQDEDACGPEILCAHGNSISVRYWGRGDDDNFAWQPRIRGCFPSHWMPLPELPTK